MAKLIGFSRRPDAEESDAKWGDESQKQQKSGRGLKREGALIFCHPFFSRHCFSFVLSTISVWTHVEILDELVLVRVHTG